MEPLKKHASLEVSLKYLVHSCTDGLRKIQFIAVLIQVQSIAVLMDLDKNLDFCEHF